MTLSCPSCDSIDLERRGDNGADYPQTLVEFYTCRQCGNQFQKVLTA
jgi:DNA-directed RNA polymerase subunit M/transcription elongation factor TFIIS